MPFTELGFALPSGTDPGSAFLQLATATYSSTGTTKSVDWTVPGGEVWLMHGFIGGFETAAGGVNRYISVELVSADGQFMYEVGHPDTVPPNDFRGVTCSLGLDAIRTPITVPTFAAFVLALPLPYMLGLPGWQYQMVAEDAQAGDKFTAFNPGSALAPTAQITAWVYGGGAAGLADLIPDLTAEEVI